MTNASGHRVERNQRFAQFLSEIEALPLEQWQRMAHDCPSRVSGALIAELRRALEASAGAFEAQRAKDRVSEALHRFESAEGRSLVRRPGAMVRIQRVTEIAALAVLARDILSRDAYRALVSGFGPLC